MPDEIAQTRINMLLIQNGDIDNPNKDAQAFSVQTSSYVRLPGEPERWVDARASTMTSVAMTPGCAHITAPHVAPLDATEEEIATIEAYNNEIVSKTDELVQTLSFALSDMPQPLFDALKEAFEVAEEIRTPVVE